MEVNLKGNTLFQDLTIEEALAVQAGLADAIAKALKYGQACGPTIAGISQNIFGKRDNPVPMAVGFNVYRGDKLRDNV
jgi:hypothetical protein